MSEQAVESAPAVPSPLYGRVLLDVFFDATGKVTRVLDVHQSSLPAFEIVPDELAHIQAWQALPSWVRTEENLILSEAGEGWMRFEHKDWLSMRLQEAMDKPLDEPIHIKRFDVRDVDEAWRAGNLQGRKCIGCGSPKVAIRIRVMMPVDEFKKRLTPGVLASIAAEFEGKVPTIETTSGPHVPISDVAACDRCRKDAEQVAARDVPSWVIVTIDQAPKHAVSVQVNGRRGRKH